MRSDPRPPPHEPLGWHIDFAFLPEHYRARPRQVYFQMITSLNTVEPGRAPFMIVPGSYHLTYAAAGRLGSTNALEPLWTRGKLNAVRTSGSAKWKASS